MKIIKANSFFERLSGLIKYNNLDDNEILVIENCKAIHTFFMKFNIDVIFTDKRNKIIKMKKNLKPWRIFIGGLQAKDVYETASGFIKKYNLKKGEILKLCQRI